METAVAAQGLSKRYRLGGQYARYRTLRESLMGRLRRRDEGARQIWALRDVGFEVPRGQAVGVVGRNGAGKSTLLKVLSRVTEPSSGRAIVWGRVGSLLEVGTGFHPELTGRENVYLNGAILGMSRADIRRRFDEIVAFAEIERFLDTPVKHYSSGMYMRLAFSVAAHLEPDVLVVDEVLAVGDTAFQQKCLGKMGGVAGEGRTVLFVSHNLAAVRGLCARGLYLRAGRLELDGPVEQVCAAYAREAVVAGTLRDGDVSAEVRALDGCGEPLAEWRRGEDLLLRVDVSATRPLLSPAVDVALYGVGGIKLFALESDRVDPSLTGKRLSRFRAEFRIRNDGLAPADLSVDVGVRADGDPRYMALFNAAERVLVSSWGLPAYFRDDGALCPVVSVCYETGG